MASATFAAAIPRKRSTSASGSRGGVAAIRNPSFELTDEGDGEGEGMRDSGRWLRGPTWAIDDGDTRDSTEGSRALSRGYLVESKRLGVARIRTLILP